jgi:hypothetical protein
VDRLGPLHLMDVVPTLSHLLGIEPPAQSQGRVIRDLFVEHETFREKRSPEVAPQWTADRQRSNLVARLKQGEQKGDLWVHD